MSNIEGKAEVQVTRPGHAFPFNTFVTPAHPHISQFCRFSVPERLPLKPFRQDRLTRLPLPPSAMATSKITSTTGAGITLVPIPGEKKIDDMDPYHKIQQLEKNLAFVRESHSIMLRDLHEEIADLKQKNRELLFQVVTGLPALPNEPADKADTVTEQKEKIEKLEKEIKKLRSALKEAMKTNASLTSQLQHLKRDHYYKTPSKGRVYSRTSPDSSVDDGHPLSTLSGPSPQMDEYSDTLRQIQRAAAQRSGKCTDRHCNDGRNSEWLEGYVRSEKNYHHHHRHHHQVQKSPQESKYQQQRLPRLPLRSQQNYSQQQYEIQYRQRSSNTLPALKQPLVPVMDHRIDKPRKPRGPRSAKVAHQVING